jgi:GT2 family glycosyltransferase
MNLSVVIPTTGKRRWLEPCLAALARAWPHSLDLEVLVVVDGPPRDEISWIPQAHPEVTVLQRPESGGFCQAANTGLAAARGAVIQFLNDDTEVLPGWAEAGLAPFADPAVAAVAPLVRQLQHPDRIDSLGDAYAAFGWAFPHARDEPAERWLLEHPFEILGASASAGFFRASVLKRLAGFDPAFSSYFEDVDLAFRIRWAGFRAVCQPASQVLHHGTGTFHQDDPALVRQMARNAERVFWFNLPGTWLCAMLIPHSVFSLLQILKAGMRGRGRAVLLGKCDALRSWRAIIQARRVRRALARSATQSPRFPLRWFPFINLIRRLSARTSRSETSGAGKGRPHVEIAPIQVPTPRRNTGRPIRDGVLP